MKIEDLFEHTVMPPTTNPTIYVTLYFGGCKGLAQTLETKGFWINTISKNKFLSLFSTPELAAQHAAKFDCDAVVKASNVPIDSLVIDFRGEYSPENMDDAIQKINDGLPVKLMLNKNLSSNNFKYINKLTRRNRD